MASGILIPPLLIPVSPKASPGLSSPSWLPQSSSVLPPTLWPNGSAVFRHLQSERTPPAKVARRTKPACLDFYSNFSSMYILFPICFFGPIDEGLRWAIWHDTASLKLCRATTVAPTRALLLFLLFIQFGASGSFVGFFDLDLCPFISNSDK